MLSMLRRGGGWRARYDDMVESVRKLAQLGVQLTVEERNLLSVAYKVRVSGFRQWF